MAKFSTTKAAERKFAKDLRKVARVVGHIVEAHVEGAVIRDNRLLQAALKTYSESLGPWASKIVGEMIDSVSKSNKRAWESASTKMGAAMRGMLAETAAGTAARLLHHRQVTLIQSLPIEAGLRAQKLAQQAAMGGRRADEVAAEIARTEDVTASRATLIARTEIAKANAAITQARAEAVGVTHYIWRTAEDGDVRDSHADMNNNVYRFDDPPDVEGEGRHGPGEIYNCRCYAEPVIPG